MAEDAPVLPFLSPVAGKPVHVAFDGGRLTSDAGVLVLAEIERRLGIADRLARCLEDPRDPERVHHGIAEMIRFRSLLIAAGYADANDCDALRPRPSRKSDQGAQAPPRLRSNLVLEGHGEPVPPAGPHRGLSRPGAGTDLRDYRGGSSGAPPS